MSHYPYQSLALFVFTLSMEPQAFRNLHRYLMLDGLIIGKEHAS